MVFNKSEYPVVGDYVTFRETNVQEGIIEKVKERKSVLRRLAVSQIHESQVIASNIDIAFICMALNEDFNIKKLQSFLSMTYSNSYERIILLSKSDLCQNPSEKVFSVKKINDETVVVMSAFNNEDIIRVKNLIVDKTCVFIGSSGVGKSTIINKLMGQEYFETQEIRLSDAQGRHTTVSRELINLENNSAVIDTPGIRIVNSYIIEDMDIYFSDILDYSKRCKFRDCSHNKEPGCAVRNALSNNELSYERFEQFKRAERLNAFNRNRELMKLKISGNKQNKKRG